MSRREKNDDVIEGMAWFNFEGGRGREGERDGKIDVL